MTERTVRANLGLDVADSEFRELAFNNFTKSLKVLFMTGIEGERLVEVLFEDAVAFRMQEAEFYIDDNDRWDDFTYEVLDSRWIATHVAQHCEFPARSLRHFKFSFGGSGPTLEVLCQKVVSNFV